MFTENNNRGSGGQEFLNLTPFIDIIFLLMIFFILVFQFIASEPAEVDIPQRCSYALESKKPDDIVINFSVIADANDAVTYAIGSQKFLYGRTSVEQLKNCINSQLEGFSLGETVINLRIDRKLPFKYARYALQSASESSADKLKLAVLKD